eukprot:Selendium_serpulae@DN5672_c0_g1_i5.p1
MECGEETEFYPTISDLLEFAARAASLNRRVITVNVVSTDSLVRVSLNCPLRPNVISGEQRNWVVAQKVKHDNLPVVFQHCFKNFNLFTLLTCCQYSSTVRQFVCAERIATLTSVRCSALRPSAGLLLATLTGWLSWHSRNTLPRTVCQ